MGKRIYLCSDPQCKIPLRGKDAYEKHMRIHRITAPPVKRELAPKRTRG